MNSLSVVFSNPTGPPHTIGPFAQLFLRGAELRETRDGPVLALSKNLRWEPTEGGTFNRFDCDARCFVSLHKESGESQRYGPYRGISSLNGLKYVDHQLFCIYDEQTKDLYGYESGVHWDSLSVVPA